MIPMAELGRSAEHAVRTAKGENFVDVIYVNKTRKYVSIKIVTGHLTPEQLEEVSNILRKEYPDRFLKVYNNTATPSRSDWIGGEFKTFSWKEEKVNVRFTQE